MCALVCVFVSVWRDVHVLWYLCGVQRTAFVWEASLGRLWASEVSCLPLHFSCSVMWIVDVCATKSALTWVLGLSGCVVHSVFIVSGLSSLSNLLKTKNLLTFVSSEHLNNCIYCNDCCSCCSYCTWYWRLTPRPSDAAGSTLVLPCLHLCLCISGTCTWAHNSILFYFMNHASLMNGLQALFIFLSLHLYS